jgi:hypothetical protein
MPFRNMVSTCNLSFDDSYHNSFSKQIRDMWASGCLMVQLSGKIPKCLEEVCKE